MTTLKDACEMAAYWLINHNLDIINHGSTSVEADDILEELKAALKNENTVVFESQEPPEVKIEEGGCKNRLEVELLEEEPLQKPKQYTSWISIESWDDRIHITNEEAHPLIKKLLGKRLRVTVEILEDEADEVFPQDIPTHSSVS